MERTAKAPAAAAKHKTHVPRLAQRARDERSLEINGHRATSWFKAVRPLIERSTRRAAPAAQTTGCRGESAGPQRESAFGGVHTSVGAQTSAALGPLPSTLADTRTNTNQID